MQKPEPISHKKAVSVALGVGIPLLFVLVVLAIFSPLLLLIGVLVLVIVIGIFYKNKPEFFSALKRKSSLEPNFQTIPPSIPPSKPMRRTYMMLVGLNALNQQRIALNETPFTIGRSASCSYQLKNDAVSSMHLTIDYDENEKVCYVTDRSTNGTFLNSVRLPKGTKKALHQGDALQIAGIIFSVEYVHY